MPRPGTILQERYEIVRVLGRGGMGLVYLAHHLGLGERPVAIKELDVHLDEELREAALAEFQREATMLASLEHPALVPATDFFEQDGSCYLVMAYIAGPTLHEVLTQSLERLPVNRVLDWADQICEVLSFLHGRTPPILYRDLKPGNLLLDEAGRLRLIDFGISRFSGPGVNTATLLVGAGTPGFAPVEQYSGGTDPRSDIYSLGATLYHLLTGEVPPVSVALLTGEACLKSPRELNPEISLGLQEVLLKMLATAREGRYATAEEARLALARTRSGDGERSSPGWRREFRVCALCRHLEMLEEAPEAATFRCQALGWQTREELIRDAVEKHLQLTSGRPGECPRWEPIEL